MNHPPTKTIIQSAPLKPDAKGFGELIVRTFSDGSVSITQGDDVIVVEPAQVTPLRQSLDQTLAAV